jgi:Fe/S biogenesis protein NfuA
MTDVVDASAGPETGEVLIVTEAAHATVMDIRSQEDDAESLGLRVEVTGVAGIDYEYDLSLEPIAETADDDHVHESNGLTVIVPAASLDQLRGATLDLPSLPGQGGLVLRNPNRPNPLGQGEPLELTGELADQVQQLLELRINPALASHGGYTTLVGVDDTKVLITMGGGCQGCALSAATLREGITAAILEAIPEVTEVVDTTDHDAGDSPYFS